MYDEQHGGRNRRYYKLTEKGKTVLEEYREEWINYSTKITQMFEGGVSDDKTGVY